MMADEMVVLTAEKMVGKMVEMRAGLKVDWKAEWWVAR